jgi:hypothetical protein
MTTTPSAADRYHPWTTYIAAREEARRQGDRKVGTDHLVLGLLRDDEISTLLGVSLEVAREQLATIDRASLAAVGLALLPEAPLLKERALPARPTIRAVLTDRLPLTPAAKTVLQEAGLPMRRGRLITSLDMMRSLLERRPDDPGLVLLSSLGLDVASLRARLRTDEAA